MIELTPEQRRELKGPGPARALDPETNQTYVLVRSDLYEQWCARPDDERMDAAALMNEAMADDDPNDPLLESYQRFRGEA